MNSAIARLSREKEVAGNVTRYNRARAWNLLVSNKHNEAPQDNDIKLKLDI